MVPSNVPGAATVNRYNLLSIHYFSLLFILVNDISTLSPKSTRWGDKENGVAGHGDTEGHQYTPKLLERLSGKHVVQISACGFHTGCLTDMGEVRMTLVLRSAYFSGLFVPFKYAQLIITLYVV